MNKNNISVWDAENAFYHKSNISRLGKLIYQYEIYKLIKDLPGDVLEFGVFKGNSLIRFLTFRSIIENNFSRKVYGFDIQSQAIEETQKKVTLTGLTEQIELYCKGHETLDKTLPESVTLQAVVFNLGYLPKSDKSIITLPETTISAIEQGLNRLAIGGIILIMVYYGHEGGTDEKNAVKNYLQKLPQEQYAVLEYGFINQKNNPPFLLAIEKKRH